MHRPACSALLCVLLGGCGGDDPADEGPGEVLPPASLVDLALEFDGVNDYVSLGTAGFPFPRVDQTISFWLRPASGGGDEQVIVTLRKDSESGVSLGLCAGAPCAKSVYSGDTYAAAGARLATAEWHHVAYRFEGGEAAPRHTLYVDGEEAASGATLPNNRTPTRAFLGTQDTRGRFFAGAIDELRVWSVARTSAQLTEEIQGQTPDSDTSALVLHYSFDEAEGARVLDHSGRRNHGLLGDGRTELAPLRVRSERP